MDYELLVEARIEDGRELIAGLVENGFDISVAFWVRVSEGNLWFLYLGTSSLRGMSLADAYRTAYSVVRNIPDTELSISNIKIIEDVNPIARAAIGLRDRFAARLPTRYNGEKLGGMSIEEAFIYPRAGEMTRTEILQAVTMLMNRTGHLAPSLVTLRDGSRLQAVPTSLRMNVPGSIQVTFHDLVASTERSISVDEIVGIL